MAVCFSINASGLLKEDPACTGGLVVLDSQEYSSLMNLVAMTQAGNLSLEVTLPPADAASFSLAFTLAFTATVGLYLSALKVGLALKVLFSLLRLRLF